MPNARPPGGPGGRPASETVGDAERGEPEFDADRGDELAYRLRQQELVAAFGLFALRTREIDEVMHEAARLAALGVYVELCKLLEYREESDDLLVRAGVGWRAGTVGMARLGADDESPAGYAYRRREAVMSNHLTGEDRFRTPDLLIAHGVRRALNVPVMYDGDPYGVLEVDTSRTGKFTTADIAFVQSLANTLSVALERHQEERALAAGRAREALLAAEMRHRVKNMLAVVSALVSMSRREAGGDADALAQMLGGRIAALASATDAGLAERGDAGDISGVDPVDLTRRVLAPYADRVTVTGRTGVVSGDVAAPLALILHELATNAVKYGALAGPEGQVGVAWDTDGGAPRLQWTEQGGPPIDRTPDPAGFGQQMIDRMLQSIGAGIERDWRQSGMVAHVTLA